MATKSRVQTAYVGRKAAENALHSVRYASDAGRPYNTHVCISFTALGLSDDQAEVLLQRLQRSIGRWWYDQRTRKGREVGALLGFHCHANPAGSRHVHWMLHVPSDVAPDFAAIVEKRLKKLAGRSDLTDALHISSVSTPGSLAKYMLRGIEPTYADYLHIEAANEGLVEGRRTSVSRAASAAARKRAGWVRKKRPRDR